MPLDYYMALWETRLHWGSGQTRQFCCRPPYPFVAFHLLPMLQNQGDAAAGINEDALMVSAPETPNRARSPIWSHLTPLGVSITREQADAAVTNRLSGYIFGVPATRPLPDPEICPPPLLCIDPALTLGLLARVAGCFYREKQLPDYGIGHLASTTFICCDSRISLDRCIEQEASAQ